MKFISCEDKRATYCINPRNILYFSITDDGYDIYFEMVDGCLILNFQHIADAHRTYHNIKQQLAEA